MASRLRRGATGFGVAALFGLGLAACNGSQPGCDALATGLEMAAAQETIITRYGQINDARNAGFAPSHLYVTFAGMGMAVARVIRIQQGAFPEMLPEATSVEDPNLLFYMPTGTPATVGLFNQPGSFSDAEADPPYRLIGWGYFVAFDPATRPTLGCVPQPEWFVHEAGWHTWDGGFVATPPPGEPAGAHGSAAISLPPLLPPPFTVVGPSGALSGGVVWHQRYWDIHVWRNDDGFPGFGNFNPFGGAPTFGAGLSGNAFFIRNF